MELRLLGTQQIKKTKIITNNRNNNTKKWQKKDVEEMRWCRTRKKHGNLKRQSTEREPLCKVNKNKKKPICLICSRI